MLYECRQTTIRWRARRGSDAEEVRRKSLSAPPPKLPAERSRGSPALALEGELGPLWGSGARRAPTSWGKARVPSRPASAPRWGPAFFCLPCTDGGPGSTRQTSTHRRMVVRLARGSIGRSCVRRCLTSGCQSRMVANSGVRGGVARARRGQWPEFRALARAHPRRMRLEL